jgi:2-polyprenyl-3-methyl-5-hydroxy-6-metoxy-1,4-benzoquinol methylase
MPIFEFEKVFDVNDYMLFYSPLLTPETSMKQADFVIKALKLDKGAKILDLCCGYGRISNRLAEQGYTVVGLDNSQGFLDIACAEAKKLNVEVEYVRGDMRQIHYEDEFDAVINIFTSFGFFSDEENFDVLKGVSSSLKTNGKFLIDTINRDWIIKNYLPYTVSVRNETYVADVNTFDPLTSINQTNRVIFSNNKIKKYEFFVRLYTYTEIAGLLKQTGLRAAASYGSFNTDVPYSLNSNRMIVISQKI